MVKKSNGARTVKIVFFALGLIFLAIGGVLTALAYDFMDNALPATGTVVSVDTDYSSDSVTYKPTIRYLDYLGSKQRGETFMSSSSYNFRVGSKVDIMYDLRDPASLRMNTWFATWGFGIVFMAASAIPFIVALLIGIFGKAKTGPEPVVKSSRAKTASVDRDDDDGYVHLKSNESAEDHAREENYTPTVRRG